MTITRSPFSDLGPMGGGTPSPDPGPGTVRPGPARHASGRRDALERLAPLLLGAAAVVMLPALALLIDRDAMGGLGLAGVLPIWAWCGIAAAVLACAVELLAPDPRLRVLTVLTGILALCTTGLPAVVEPGARMGVSWTHLGFVEVIAGSGHAPLGVDSRFSWAGFFSQWAWISDAAGGLHLDVVLRWAPPVIALLWAAGVYAIAQRLLGGVRAPWVAAWLFMGLNWIEQDYFSPQATAMLLALAVLVVAIGPLATEREPLTAGTPPQRVRALLSPSTWSTRAAWARLRSPHPPVPMAQILLAWVVVGLCCVAIAVSHQLTPFALLAQLGLLTVAGRVWGGRGLMLVLGLSVLTWIVLGGREFWLHEITLATGGVGDATGAVASSLNDRLVGDPGQVAVKAGRVVLALATVVLGALGAWVRWRRTGQLVWFPVALLPAGIVVFQTYGGEVLMRVLLYALPLLAVLGVEALRALVRWRPRAVRIALVVGMVAMFGILVTVRGGNDAYVALRPQEIDLTRAVLEQAPNGGKVLPLTSQAPVQVTRVGEVVQTPSACESLMDDPVRCTLADRPDAVWSLPTMDAQGVVLEGRTPGWSRGAIEAIAATGVYRITVDDGLYLVAVRND